MSKTIRIVNGQIDIDPATGLVETVEGNRKAAQDMAECLLQDYLPEIDYGSFLRALVLNQIPNSGDLFIRFYIADAIQKLQAKQQDDPYLTEAEQITQITELQVANDQQGTVVFFVAAATADGGDASLTAAQATQLNQQYERF